MSKPATSEMIAVYRHFWKWSTAMADDAEVAGRLHTDWIRYTNWRDNADSIFKGKPELFAAYEDGDAETFARLLGVPWPVPVPVTLQSLTAELAALTAKFKAFAGG